MTALDVDVLLTWYRGFPFGEDAFCQRIWALNRLPSGALDRPTQTLAQLADVWIAARAVGRSIDTVGQLRTRAWFVTDHAVSVCTREVQLRDLLRDTAAQVLEYNGASYKIRETNPYDLQSYQRENERAYSAHNTLLFRWLSLEFPSDILISALHSNEGTTPELPLSLDPNFSNIALEKVLSTGVAETHMHVNNGVDGLWLWLRWLRGLGEVSLPPFKPLADDPMPVPLGSTDALIDTGLCIAIARLALYEKLINEREYSRVVQPSSSLLAWLESRFRPLLSADDLPVIEGAIRHLIEASHPSPPRDDLRKTYKNILYRSKRSDGVLGALEDALEPFGALDQPGIAGRETALNIAGFRLLPDRASEFEWEHKLFWQYLRFRVMVHRFLSQRPGVAGLDWFRYYDRRLKLFYLRPDMGRSIGHAFSLHRRGVALRAMEARVPVEGEGSDARAMLLRTLDSALDTLHGISLEDARSQVAGLRVKSAVASTCRKSCEIGLVLHFGKETHHEGAHSQRPEDRDDPFGGQEFRWQSWLRKNHKGAGVLEELFRHYPTLLLLIRGVDVAARELSMPLWPTLGPLKRVRDAAIKACAKAMQSHPELKIQPLRNTFHVGEDYRRLVEGLRRIHELLEYGVIGNNDRLGHALALGDQPERLSQDHPIGYQPAEERLDDLLWELDRYQQGDIQDLWGRSPVIHREIQGLVDRLYANNNASNLFCEHAQSARRYRHSPALFEAFVPKFYGGFDASSLRRGIAAQPETCGMIQRYFQDRQTWLAGQVPTRIDCAKGEVSFLIAVQRWLRETISQRQITIESNPSSNLLVGNYHAFTSLPTFQMHPVRPTEHDNPRMQLSINTDDPLTFATDIGREYAYVLAAMTKANVPMQDAIEWIDRVRECGLRSRFTLKASADPRALIELRNDLKPYSQFE